MLFTDVGLPGGMNGRQLASAARQLNRKLKVLFTTGYARNAIVHEGRLDPGVQLITKPFTYAALSGKVRDMLDARAATPRILVVEDEDLIQMLLSSQLEDLGFEVEIAGSAAAAKNKLMLKWTQRLWISAFRTQPETRWCESCERCIQRCQL